MTLASMKDRDVRGQEPDRRFPGLPGERSEPGSPGRGSEAGRGRGASLPGPDPEVSAKAKRRQFSAEYKRRIVEEADRCKADGEVGALLRREGLYSSHLSSWRQQQTRGELRPKTRGRKADPRTALRRENQKLLRENERLRRELEKAKGIIDLQKKLSEVLGIETNPPVSLEDIDAPRSKR